MRAVSRGPARLAAIRRRLAVHLVSHDARLPADDDERVRPYVDGVRARGSAPRGAMRGLSRDDGACAGAIDARGRRSRRCPTRPSHRACYVCGLSRGSPPWSVRNAWWWCVRALSHGARVRPSDPVRSRTRRALPPGRRPCPCAMRRLSPPTVRREARCASQLRRPLSRLRELPHRVGRSTATSSMKRSQAFLVVAAAVTALGAGSTNGLAQTRVESPHGSLSTPCAQCHAATTWKPARVSRDFRHAPSRFPLEGAHSRTTCAGCHRSLEFKNVRTTCIGCHTDVHRGELGGDCER